jgi:hypothetical protein
MKSAVVVLGMHRSGTSAVTGALTLLGAERPKSLVEGDANNERGYFESRSVMDLNEEILASGGSSWNDWRNFNPNWQRTTTADDFRDRATSILLQEFEGSPLIALKDPRICRLAPFWFSALSNAGYQAHGLVVVRNPLEVAASLRRRDGFPTGLSLLIWLRHVLDAEAASRNSPRSILILSDLLSDWRGAFEKIGSELGLEWPRLSDFTADQIDAFLVDDLRHQRVDDPFLRGRADINEWALNAYEALKVLSAEPNSNSARDVLDDILRDFNKTTRIYGPAFSALESEVGQLKLSVADLGRTTSERDAAVARLDELELLTEGLRTQLTEMDATNADHLIREEAAAGRLVGFMQEMDAERDRASQIEQELSEARAKFATVEEAINSKLDSAMQEIAEQQQRAERIASELSETQTQLIQRESALTAELASTSAAVAEQRNQVAALDAELSKAQTTLELMTADAEAERFRAARFEEELDQARLQLTANHIEFNAQLDAGAQASQVRLAEHGLAENELGQARLQFQAREEALAARLELAESDAQAVRQRAAMLAEEELGQARLQFQAREEALAARLELAEAETQVVRQRAAMLQENITEAVEELGEIARTTVFKRKFDPLKRILSRSRS